MTPTAPSPGRRLLAEGAWIAAGQAAAALALLAGTRALTEAVPPAVYGVVGLLVGAMTFGRNLVCTPLLQGLLRFYPDAARAGKLGGLRHTAGGLLVRTTAARALVLAAAGALAAAPLGIPATAFLALAGLLAADVARSFELNLLNAAQRQRAFAAWGAADAWARPALAVLLVFVAGATAEAVLAGFLIAATGVYAAMPRVGRQPGASDRDAGGLASDLRRYALPLAPLAVVAWIVSLGDRYLIAAWLGTREVGLYAAAYGLVGTPFLMAQSVIESSLRPVYFDAVSAGDRAREAQTFRTWLGATAAVCAAGVAIVAHAHEALAGLTLAPAYRAASPLMPWIALGHGLLAVSYVFEKPCYAYRKTGRVLAIQTAGAVACLATVPALVAFHGLAGAAAAVPIYFGVQLAAAVIAARDLGRPS